VKAGIQKAEALGIKVLGTYYMHGEYDFVIIADVPDDKAGTAWRWPKRPKEPRGVRRCARTISLSSRRS
jgi:hypothetical protein